MDLVEKISNLKFSNVLDLGIFMLGLDQAVASLQTSTYKKSIIEYFPKLSDHDFWDRVENIELLPDVSYHIYYITIRSQIRLRVYLYVDEKPYRLQITKNSKFIYDSATNEASSTVDNDLIDLDSDVVSFVQSVANSF